jgi:hypothetical protein
VEDVKWKQVKDECTKINIKTLQQKLKSFIVYRYVSIKSGKAENMLPKNNYLRKNKSREFLKNK